MHWLVKRDLEYYANVLGSEHWAKGDRPCMACKVDKGPFAMDRPQTCGGPSVQWTPNEWRAAHPNVHNIFNHVHVAMVLAVGRHALCVFGCGTTHRWQCAI